MHGISQALPTFPLPVISPMAIVPRTSSTPHALTSSVFSASPPHQASTPLFPSPPTRSPTLSLALSHLARPGQAKPGYRFTFSPVVPLRWSQWSNCHPHRNRQYSSDHGTFLEKGRAPSRHAPLCRLRFQERRQRHQRLNPQPALRPLPRVHLRFPMPLRANSPLPAPSHKPTKSRISAARLSPRPPVLRIRQLLSHQTGHTLVYLILQLPMRVCLRLSRMECRIIR
jgi:hypothetical protein